MCPEVEVTGKNTAVSLCEQFDVNGGRVGVAYEVLVFETVWTVVVRSDADVYVSVVDFTVVEDYGLGMWTCIQGIADGERGTFAHGNIAFGGCHDFCGIGGYPVISFIVESVGAAGSLRVTTRIVIIKCGSVQPIGIGTGTQCAAYAFLIYGWRPVDIVVRGIGAGSLVYAYAAVQVACIRIGTGGGLYEGALRSYVDQGSGGIIQAVSGEQVMPVADADGRRILNAEGAFGMYVSAVERHSCGIVDFQIVKFLRNTSGIDALRCVSFESHFGVPLVETVITVIVCPISPDEQMAVGCGIIIVVHD